MINVNNLTKYYGDYPAIQDVTFEVPRGQIVGFLGPNGAGKSTTMRILAGFLTATSGQASIDGIDIFWKPLDARRRIGYMPESCPLYPEMRVVEYLHFRAGIKGLSGARRKQRLEYVLGRCWLGDVRRQLIGTLSKGYRQRVGLADALLAEPPVLILDEPTAGLDPTQIRSTRSLIRELGQEHTILLSTHILPEVEMTCDRVIIIARGRVVESRSMAELTSEKTYLLVDLEGTIEPQALGSLPGVIDVQHETVDGGMRLRLTTAKVEHLMPSLWSLTVDRGWKLRELKHEHQTLEEKFVQLTGRDEAIVTDERPLAAL
jgi:ABC-2 type transport system ATP-binding protein